VILPNFANFYILLSLFFEGGGYAVRLHSADTQVGQWDASIDILEYGLLKACLVCFISTVNSRSKKRRKEAYYELR
jgi:hypothetical protein